VVGMQLRLCVLYVLIARCSRVSVCGVLHIAYQNDALVGCRGMTVPSNPLLLPHCLQRVKHCFTELAAASGVML